MANKPHPSIILAGGLHGSSYVREHGKPVTVQEATPPGGGEAIPPRGCSNCDSGGFGKCPRCFENTEIGCGHGELCPECSDETVEQRIDAALDSAQEAFWGAFAAKFPEITTGDFEALALVRFTKACADAGREWLLWNDFQRLQ